MRDLVEGGMDRRPSRGSIEERRGFFKSAEGKSCVAESPDVSTNSGMGEDERLESRSSNLTSVVGLQPIQIPAHTRQISSYILQGSVHFDLVDDVLCSCRHRSASASRIRSSSVQSLTSDQVNRITWSFHCNLPLTVTCLDTERDGRCGRGCAGFVRSIRRSYS